MNERKWLVLSWATCKDLCFFTWQLCPHILCLPEACAEELHESHQPEHQVSPIRHRHHQRREVWAQIYYNNTTLQCARCPCSLGTWLTLSFHDYNWRQSVFIYTRNYQSYLAWKHLHQLHHSCLKCMMSVCVWTGLDKLSRSACAIIAGTRISIRERG